MNILLAKRGHFAWPSGLQGTACWFKRGFKVWIGFKLGLGFG